MGRYLFQVHPTRHLKKPLMLPRIETRSKNWVGLMGTVCDRLSVRQYVYKFHNKFIQYL